MHPITPARAFSMPVTREHRGVLPCQAGVLMGLIILLMGAARLEANDPPVVSPTHAPVAQWAWVSGPFTRTTAPTKLSDLLAGAVFDPNGDPLSIKVEALPSAGSWESSPNADFTAPTVVEVGSLIPLTDWVRFRPVPYSSPPGDPGTLADALVYLAWDGAAYSVASGVVHVDYRNLPPHIQELLIDSVSIEASDVIDIALSPEASSVQAVIAGIDPEGDDIQWGYVPIGAEDPEFTEGGLLSDAVARGQCEFWPDGSSLVVTYLPDHPITLPDELRIVLRDVFGAERQLTLRFLPPELPTVTIQAVGLADAIPEQGYGTSMPAGFVISRGVASSEYLSVRLSISGTAEPDVDYEMLPDWVTIPAGSDQVFIPVLPIDDDVAEGPETIEASIVADPEAYQIGSPSSATATILDDDLGQPYFTAPAAGASWIAVVGRPWEALVAAEHEAPGMPLTLELVEPPGWLTAAPLAAGRWRLSGTPEATGAFSIVMRVEDGQGGHDERSLSLTVVAAQTATVPIALPPVSTRSSPRYGAIAPGSAAGFHAIVAAVGDLMPIQARGVWWQAGYRDLPEMPPHPLHAGMFLATTVERSIALPTIPAQPVPHAIPLPAGIGWARWSLIGVPPVLAETGGAPPELAHPWDDFRLEDADGVPVTDPATVLDVLASGTDPDPRTRIAPYVWNGTAYVRATTLHSGVAYWVPNFSHQAYRLVRTGPGDRTASFGSLDFGAPAHGFSMPRATRAAAASTRAGPPLPPHGDAAGDPPPASSAGSPGGAQASDAGGCGAGALAGLLVMTAVALRRVRQRA